MGVVELGLDGEVLGEEAGDLGGVALRGWHICLCLKGSKKYLRMLSRAGMF